MSAHEDLQNLRNKSDSLARRDIWDEQAMETNQKLIELMPRYASAYTRLAKCYESKHHYSKVYDLCERILQIDPRNSVALKMKDRAEVHVADSAQLAEIEKVSSYSEAIYTGKAARDAGQFKLAIAAYKRAIALDETQQHAHVGLASAYRHAHALEKAESKYHEILDLFNRPTIALIGLAAVYRDLEKCMKAERLYKEALKKDSKNSYALNGLGGLYSDLDDLYAATDCFTKAAKHEGARVSALEALNTISKRYEEKGLHEKSMKLKTLIEHLRKIGEDS
jgi:tetratricopeptide (TPR) repeat protein